MRVASSHAVTDPGRKRRRKEDSYVIAPPLFAVADGMGGAQAGEVASGLAAAALEESGANGGGEQRVAELIQEANRRVHQRATTDATTAGMGTTITAALVEPDGRVVFGHVGDSRAYLLRYDRLEQLTDDHTLVAELVRRGELSPRPEDGVAPPPPLEGDYDAAPRPAAVPAAVDTMVVPASEIDAALARQEEEHVPQAGLGRRLLALLVIVILVATIVVLVWWGLAR